MCVCVFVCVFENVSASDIECVCGCAGPDLDIVVCVCVFDWVDVIWCWRLCLEVSHVVCSCQGTCGHVVLTGMPSHICAFVRLCARLQIHVRMHACELAYWQCRESMGMGACLRA